MRDTYQTIRDQGADIVAIASEPVSAMIEAVEQARLPFPLLSDGDLTAIDAYGVRHRDEPKGRQIARPALFLLDQMGVVRYAYVGEHERDRPALGTILLGLETISDGTKDEIKRLPRAASDAR